MGLPTLGWRRLRKSRLRYNKFEMFTGYQGQDVKQTDGDRSSGESFGEESHQWGNLSP